MVNILIILPQLFNIPLRHLINISYLLRWRLQRAEQDTLFPRFLLSLSREEIERPAFNHSSAAPAKSGPLDFPSEKSFLLFFAHEKDLGHMFQK